MVWKSTSGRPPPVDADVGEQPMFDLIPGGHHHSGTGASARRRPACHDDENGPVLPLSINWLQILLSIVQASSAGYLAYQGNYKLARNHLLLRAGQSHLSLRHRGLSEVSPRRTHAKQSFYLGHFAYRAPG
jgi:hypothetical protein